jgi:glycosyltransferase involved in cell wall biosynthesis
MRGISNTKYKEQVADYLTHRFPQGGTALDIGAGSGTYAKLVGHHFQMTAVEVDEKTAEENRIERLYEKVIIDDIKNIEIGQYDLIILGDVLEHLTVSEAQELLERLDKGGCYKEMLIAVPYLYKQGATGGNEYEVHKQDDLTHKIFMERYKGFRRLVGDNNYGYYIRKADWQTTEEPYRLSVVIPRYKEDENKIKPLLSMLNSQIAVDFNDFEVVIVNNNNPKLLDEDFMRSFENLNIYYIDSDVTGGAGAARQVGIDNCHGEYIMFVDADDRLYSVGVISNVLKEIDSGNWWDLLSSPFIEEHEFSNGERVYIKRVEKWTWLHGKVYKRKYVLGNPYIRFPDDMRTEEDVYFNLQCLAYTNKVKTISAPSVVWCFNKDSITRENHREYLWTCPYRHLGVIGRVIDTFVQTRRPIEIIKQRVTRESVYIYFLMQAEHWRSADAEKYKPELLEAWGEFNRKYEEYLYPSKSPEFAEIYNRERGRQEKTFMEEFGYDELAKMVQKV